MLSSDFPIQKVCKIMNVNRSSFYKWRKRRMNPTERQKQEMLILSFLKNIMINIQHMVIDG